MSQLSQLKQQIASLGDTATKTAGSLQSFESQFTAQIQSVAAIMGGSAQSTDREVISQLQQASKAVKQAAVSLQQAGNTAKKYGSSL